MIRPHHFYSNPETLVDNAFQAKNHRQSTNEIAKQAYDQVSSVANELAKAGVEVIIFEDQGSDTPDSVFPNNWFSTHTGGHIAIYPMFAENRRQERRTDVIEYLKRYFRVQDVIDYSGLELDELFLEGTGAMVLDHIERIAYAAKSKRTDSLVLERFCTQFNYEPMVFDAVCHDGVPVYHTNVLMCIGTEYAMAGFSMITDPQRRGQIRERLEQSGRKLIELTAEQIGCFCGNALELSGKHGRVLAISDTAYRALQPRQINILEESVQLLPMDVSVIEQAGGSIRCMLAGIHLSKR